MRERWKREYREREKKYWESDRKRERKRYWESARKIERVNETEREWQSKGEKKKRKWEKETEREMVLVCLINKIQAHVYSFYILKCAESIAKNVSLRRRCMQAFMQIMHIWPGDPRACGLRINRHFFLGAILMKNQENKNESYKEKKIVDRTCLYDCSRAPATDVL